MTALIEVSGLSKAFGGIRALDDVSFAIDRPGIYGLIGPNGAGKTTLFDVMTGRQAPDAGSVKVAGEETAGRPSHTLLRRGVVRTFQECRIFPDMTCMENLLFAAQKKGLAAALAQSFTRDLGARHGRTERARHLLSLVNLDGYADAPADNLSFGQKRLLEIVSTFMVNARVLLLDEPASGVNPALLETLHEFILRMHAETPVVFLIVEHNMDFIMELSQHIFVMHQGAVLEEGAPEAIQASPRVIEAYLG